MLPSAITDLANRLGVRQGSGKAALLTQAGIMRDRPNGRAMTFTARQRIDFQYPAFDWCARTGPFGLLSVRDALKNDEPTLDIKVLGIRIVSAPSDSSATKGEIMRYLAELAWAPDAIMRNARLQWRVLDSDTFLVAYEARSARGAVQLGLDSEGRIASVYAPDRPRKEGAIFVERPWRGRFFDYRWHEGRWLPFAGEVGWEIAGESFVAWHGELTGWSVQV